MFTYLSHNSSITIYEPFSVFYPSEVYFGTEISQTNNITNKKRAFPGMNTDPGIRDEDAPLGESSVLFVLVFFTMLRIYFRSRKNNKVQSVK